MRAVAVAIVALLVLPFTPVPAQAEEVPLSVDLELDRSWFGPGDPLALTAEVHNPSPETIEDLRMTVALFERLLTRSGLRDAFQDGLPQTPLEAFTVRIDPLPSGGRRTIRIERALKELEVFEDAPDGLYPLSVTVRRSTGPALAEAATAIALLGGPVSNPLRLLPVVTVFPEPVLHPDGDIVDGGADLLQTLADAVEALPRQPPFGLAVSPLLIEELRHLTASPVEAAEPGRALRTALASRGEPLRVPRVHAPLPHLLAQGGRSAVLNELAAGGRTLAEALEGDVARLLLPPDLALSEATLAMLAEAGIDTALAPGAAVGEGSLTPAVPMRTAGVTLVPTDEALGESIREATTPIEVDRAVAETAMVFFESPGRRRTVAVLIPPGSSAARFLDRVSTAPWLAVTGPADAAPPDPSDGIPTFDPSPPPDADLPVLVRRAREAIGRFATYTLPNNPVRGRLETALGLARSTALWEGGSRWAAQIVDAVEAEANLISLSGGPVTFTSSRGEIPITIANRASYPVRLRVEVASPKVRFPEGSSLRIDPLRPPGETVVFPAVAESSGTFPLEITLTSPDGRVRIAADELIVRSTAFNVVAGALTLAGAVFLAIWYGRRLLHRGARRREAEPRAPTRT